MIQHPLSGMHVVLIKTAGGRKAGVCYISKYFRAAWTKLYKNDPNADPAEADYKGWISRNYLHHCGKSTYIDIDNCPCS